MMSADHGSGGWAEEVTTWFPGHPDPGLDMPQTTPRPLLGQGWPGYQGRAGLFEKLPANL